MQLQPGQSLLHYRLVEKIGAGGMGEVWRAVDTQLDREVAIKVLPPDVANDRERLLRLEREAKLLASLNHPSIAAIYGFPEAGVRFLAMELVRGEDLAQVLARGPMPVREALDAARQVASALEAAHDNGVVHRDLKPANVKRTPEGQIKVLDFGLAKALVPSGMDSGQSATVTSAGSAAGLILGTASYMSPEQARGLPVDKRTDLWAFGCLLYEMLSGVKAFDGPTVTDVLAAVVTGEPDWEKLPASTPASVRRLLRRCLEKDARKRLRDAGDASLLLDENPEDARTAPVPRVAAARSFFRPAMGIALAIAAAGLYGGWWLAHRGADAPKPGDAIAFNRITYSRGTMRAARFAPDGRTIVYGAAWGGPPIKLYMSRTDSSEATPIAVPPAELLAIGKNGDMLVALGLAYYGWMGTGTLAQTSVLGGAPREILENVRSADWSPDGKQIAVSHLAQGFDQLEYPIGTVLAKTNGYFSDVRVSPDGGLVAFTDHPAWGDNLGGVSMVDRSGKKTQLATGFSAIQGLAWAPGGKEIWFSATPGDQGSTLYAVDLGGHRRSIYPSMIAFELFDIAPDGRILLAAERSEREAVALLAGYGEARPLIIPGESSVVRAVAPDGRAVLVANQAIKDYETYLIRSDQPGATRISAGESIAISPDGNLAMASAADYKTLFVTPLRMGSTRVLPNPGRIEYLSLSGWLPDSKRFVLVGRKGSELARGYVLDLETGEGKPFTAPGVGWAVFTSPPVSPDGRYAILQDGSGAAKRWPIAGGDPLPIPGLLPEDQPLAWTENGRELFVAEKALPIPIVRVDLESGKRTPWMTLAPTDSAGLRYAIPTVTPNGKYWALSVAKLMCDLYVVEGFR